MNQTEEITREILRARTKESMAKRDHIHLTLPKGTIKMIADITGEKPSTYCSKVIMDYIKKLSEE